MAAARPPVGLSEEDYEGWAAAEAARWRAEVLAPPGALASAARGLQQRINRAIPERIHVAATAVIEKMTLGILTGADLTTPPPLREAPLSERDRRALAAVGAYRKAAAVEGGVAGAGGFWLAAADFPALIAIKIKLLFDLAALYGHDGAVFSERLYILHLFQLAFSSAEHRSRVFEAIQDWDRQAHPEDFGGFNWRSFQQEYRDHIDLAKLAQLLPVVGAPIGAAVNWRLTEKLGRTAINGYRLRRLAEAADSG